MVILEAKVTPGDRPGSACEGFAKETGVRSRPIQVLPCKGFPAELPIVCYPAACLIILLGPDDGGLVGE